MDADYHALLDEAEALGIEVKENRAFSSDADALIFGEIIGLSEKLTTTAEKKCALAEELSHYKYNVGSLLNQTETEARRQEYRARKRACLDLIDVPDLIAAYTQGMRNQWEMAEYLGVTEKFLAEAIAILIRQYGQQFICGDYMVSLSPLYIYRVADETL